MNETTFWSHVVKTETCWHWNSTKDIHGYGKWDIDGKTRGAHRIAYELTNGVIEKGKVLDHICHNPKQCPGGSSCPHRACVNPSHLKVSTHQQNTSEPRTIYWQSKKTHCAKGHEFSESNTYRPPRGGRMCKACKKVNDKKLAQRKQEAYKLMKEMGLL